MRKAVLIKNFHDRIYKKQCEIKDIVGDNIVLSDVNNHYMINEINATKEDLKIIKNRLRQINNEQS